MKRIDLSLEIPDEQVAALAGKRLKDDAFDILVGAPRALNDPRLAHAEEDGPVAVYRPGGELLMKYLPNAISGRYCERAYPVLRRAGGEPTNRSTAAGVKSYRRTLEDGSKSKTVAIKLSDFPRLKGVGSAIIGAFERDSPRFPMCRLTAYTMDHPEVIQGATPFILAVDQVFKKHCPERHHAQMQWAERTNPGWVIPGTAFTTVTVNRNFRTAVHHGPKGTWMSSIH